LRFFYLTVTYSLFPFPSNINLKIEQIMRDRKKNQSSCLIIGGGITGLIIATILQRNGIKVIVLDKGRGIGGRLATRKFQEGVFDYGAQYFTVKNPKFQKWVNEWLEAGIITQWCQKFAPEDDPKPRYRGVVSNRSIAKFLAQDLEVHTNKKVIKIKYDNQWLITTETGEQFLADTLIMTPPVPQSLTLLNDSKIEIPSDIKTSLEQITYYQCIAVLALLAKPSYISVPGGIALEDSDFLVWLADNYQKGISPTYGVTLHATIQRDLLG
jgi:renalase